MSVPNDIILFHYPFSPYARRVIWYLQLRGIAYAQCLQPPVLPRPDLNDLGVQYRRIPVLSIGRDIYCDSRLILAELEAKFPDGALGSPLPENRGIEKLLDSWTVDSGVFTRASQLIPLNFPVMKDERFLKDRSSLSGANWDISKRAQDIPEALAHIKDAFNLLEDTLLADGRDWILKTSNPALADIHAIWPFHWLVDMKGALPPEVISEKQFPKTFAWINRFKAALKTAKQNSPQPVTLKGPEALEHVVAAKVVGDDFVDPSDPLQLQKGMSVQVSPIDTGFTHKDSGALVKLSSKEVVIASKTRRAGKEVHLHMPRWGFRIRKLESGGSPRL